MIKCVFLTDLRSKTMTCYTFSVRQTIPESRNVKVAMKKFDEEENEDFCEEGYFNFEELSLGEKKYFGKIFAVDGVSFTKLKINFRKIFVKSFFVSKSLK